MSSTGTPTEVDHYDYVMTLTKEDLDRKYGYMDPLTPHYAIQVDLKVGQSGVSGVTAYCACGERSTVDRRHEDHIAITMLIESAHLIACSTYTTIRPNSPALLRCPDDAATLVSM